MLFKDFSRMFKSLEHSLFAYTLQYMVVNEDIFLHACSFTQLRTCVIKNCNTPGRSLNVVYYQELLLKERIRSLWEQIFCFKSIPILKREATEENHCLSK